MSNTCPTRLMQVPLVKKIYSSWIRQDSIGRVHDWDDFTEFLAWSLENGARMGLRCVRMDIKKIYSPDNCVWQHELRYSDSDEEGFTEAKWNSICSELRAKLGILDDIEDRGASGLLED